MESIFRANVQRERAREAKVVFRCQSLLRRVASMDGVNHGCGRCDQQLRSPLRGSL